MTLPELVRLGFETDEGFGARARIGLIVLETDQTIEAEAEAVVGALAGVTIYHSRIAMDPEVTQETLTAMKARLPEAAALLPNAFSFDAIGYGCTSAATLIGSEGVANCIESAHPGVPNTEPITAAIAAMHALGAGRVAIVTPYTAEVTAPVARRFAAAGLEVSGLGSFTESNDLVVARISPESIAAGVRAIVRQGDCDAVFVSCTSLRVLGIATELEAELGVPVVSSNMALVWHLLRLAGVDDDRSGLGRLFGCPLR
ncbi:MAG: maleate cis-trans isomerase family protein [Acidimicrobiales bacterium]